MSNIEGKQPVYIQIGLFLKWRAVIDTGSKKILLHWTFLAEYWIFKTLERAAVSKD
jgi:hypothetical protein